MRPTLAFFGRRVRLDTASDRRERSAHSSLSSQFFPTKKSPLPSWASLYDPCLSGENKSADCSRSKEEYSFLKSIGIFSYRFLSSPGEIVTGKRVNASLTSGSG